MIEPLHHIRDVAEASGLRAISEDGQLLPPESLADKGGNSPTIVHPHLGTESIEDAGYFGIHLVDAVIGDGHRLGKPFGFVIDPPGTYGIHIAPVVFILRAEQGVAIDL